MTSEPMPGKVGKLRILEDWMVHTAHQSATKAHDGEDLHMHQLPLLYELG